MMGGYFLEIYRRSLKVNTDKSKGIVITGEEGSVCEVLLGWT